MKKIIEIKAAEGGTDAKLFVSDLATAYMKLSTKLGWKSTLSSSSGTAKLVIQGKDLSKLKHESGGHRIQRIPPTEKRGRVHTSTVTVAITDPITTPIDFVIPENELKVEWFSGTGAGGQHRNKKKCSARITHIPTGLVSTAQTRSRQSSYNEAIRDLTQKVSEQINSVVYSSVSSSRKEQMGSGQRGDKIRTYRFQEDMVKDHQTGKTAKLSSVMNGGINKLWK